MAAFWGAVVVALAGAAASESASSKAAKAQQAGTGAATEEQAREFDAIQKAQAPFQAAGNAGLNRLRDMLGFGDSSSYNNAIDKTQFITGYNKQLVPASLGNIDKAGYLEANPDVAASSVYGSNPEGHFQDWGVRENRKQYVNTPIYDTDKMNAAIAQAKQDQPYGSLQKKFSVADFWNDPVTQLSYQSGLDLGTKALKNAAPLTTGLDSGAALKELTKFGTDYTGMKAGDAYARHTGDQTNQFNRLAAMAGIGQTANQTTATAGMNMGNNVSALLAGQGNANAAMQIARGNANTGAVTSVANWWQQQQMLNRMGYGNQAYPGQANYSGPVSYIQQE